MGGGQSLFDEDELRELAELTYFTQKEILHVWKRFSRLDQAACLHNKDVILPMRTIVQLQELASNPFRDRIIKVFSPNGDGDMSFEDFLDMMSTFSESAPKSVKIEYAFRIYDFDEDDAIGESDLKRVIKRLCGEQKLSEDALSSIVKKVLKEADLDDDDYLSFSEFEHVISKAPDFMDSFRIRL